MSSDALNNNKSTLTNGTHAPARDHFDDEYNLRIVGIGVQYPPYHNGPEAVDILAKRFYPASNPMSKVLSINRFTGIAARSAIGTYNHPAANQSSPPSIRDLNDLFMDWGVRLATSACTQALFDAGLTADCVTHMVSTTCTNSANPGYDHFVARNLGLKRSTEKVLLHGVGCSGGLAAIRTACGLALGASARKQRARVLVCATEISSVLVRSELESIHKGQEIRVGVCLFSDCSSACVVSNRIGEEDGVGEGRDSVFDILGWKHELLDQTTQDLGFDVDPLGWKVILTPRVPSVTSAALPPAFASLVASIPSLPTVAPAATDFDWALHPGGASILTGAQEALGITEEHLICAYETYVSHGNSSSATILSVLNRERHRGRTAGEKKGQGDPEAAIEEHEKTLPRKLVVAAAFGPGVTLEMMMLKRGSRGGGQVANRNGHCPAEAAADGGRAKEVTDVTAAVDAPVVPDGPAHVQLQV